MPPPPNDGRVSPDRTMNEVKSLASDRQQRQEATFVRWVNAAFKRAGQADKLENLSSDLTSGINLIKLMKVLCPDVAVPNYNKNPKMRFALMENLNRALEMVEEGGIKTVGIGADNIADHNMMLILGLIWSIIYHVRIGKIQIGEGKDGKSGREGLLFWCQRQTANYESEGVKVKNFTSSWSDGLALAALIENNRPDLLSFQGMKALGKPQAVVAECIRVAEESLEVPRLLEVDDILIADDEKVMMAYVSEFYTLFAKQSQAQDAVRRAQRFVQLEMKVADLVEQYEKGVPDFTMWADGVFKEFGTLEVADPSLEDAWAKTQRAEAFRANEAKDKTKQCHHLIHLYDEIQLNCRTHNRKKYETPEGILTGPELKHLSSELTQKAWDFIRAVREYYDREKTKAAAQYVSLVEELNTWMKSIEGAVMREASTAGDQASMEKSHAQLAELQEEVHKQDLFKRTQEAAEHLQQGGVPTHTVGGTHHRWDEMCWRMETLQQNISQKKTCMEEELEQAKAQAAGVPQEKVEEYREIFHVFDEKKENCLSLSQFGDCLKGVGIQVSDVELEPLYRRYAVEGVGIPFDNFITFMWENTQDVESKEQVMQSFRSLAKDKDFITEEDLSSVDPAVSLFCIKHFPRGPHGFDYSTFVASKFL
uniref:Uncharacterized protein n=1 Tax=Eutreptiella gymnastica TaxID=73025 RepID=A0A7S1NDG1_9EUGL|mmetsp:Transcript_19204/g.33952  ORF Transcript_19204/g.33952 Transcript_19204/m.33952 type:complete len:651 (+) Transcript_19204:22-1974(+)